ncbi:hypothetical protein NV379_02510 [Paenibacillus sp. N1-5-1-14]|uniref:hypothetical protein n=1 Tax=Paenibacillus radicibacter TaxID=2972488 RepID=UPI002159656A|nr:hypothetical protein [Paenibacillus radicibacter]MCR8641519.1 hypothetical protein [Paenibacillus radicibacter]
MPKHNIILGQRYERLVIIKEVESVKSKRRVLCKCDCKEETVVDFYKLRTGIVKSCGCYGRELASKPKSKDLTDKKFGQLTVLHRDSDKKIKGSAVWICECECNERISVPARDLVSKNTKSCGCVGSDFIKTLQAQNEENHYKDGAFVPLLNQKVQTNNKTGYKGITIRKGNNGSIRYIANITVKNERHYLGIHDTIDLAIAAREKGEEKYYKPYLEDFKNEQRTD